MADIFDYGPLWLELRSPDTRFVCQMLSTLLGLEAVPVEHADGPVTALRDVQKNLVALVAPSVGERSSTWMPVFASGTRPGSGAESTLSPAGWDATALRDPHGAWVGLATRWGPPSAEFAVTGASPVAPWCELESIGVTGLFGFYSALLGVDFAALQHDGTLADPELDWGNYHLLVRAGRALGGTLESAYFGRRDFEPQWIVYPEVADLEASTALAVEFRCKVEVPPSDAPFGRYALLRDPFGSLFGLGEADSLTQTPGFYAKSLASGARFELSNLLRTREYSA